MSFHGQATGHTRSLKPGESGTAVVGDFGSERVVRYNVVASNDPMVHQRQWQAAATRLGRLMGFIVGDVMVISGQSRTISELRHAAELPGFMRDLTSFQLQHINQGFSGPNQGRGWDADGLAISVGRDNRGRATNGHGLVTALSNAGLDAGLPVCVFVQPEYVPPGANSEDYPGELRHYGHLGDVALQEFLLNLDAIATQ